MAVEADLRVVAELCDEGRHALADLVEDQCARGVDDVDALAAGVGHDPALHRQRVRVAGVRHHQEADGLEAQLAGEAEVLDGDVRFGAVGRDPHDRHAQRRRCT